MRLDKSQDDLAQQLALGRGQLQKSVKGLALQKVDILFPALTVRLHRTAHPHAKAQDLRLYLEQAGQHQQLVLRRNGLPLDPARHRLKRNRAAPVLAVEQVQQHAWARRQPRRHHGGAQAPGEFQLVVHGATVKRLFNRGSTFAPGVPIAPSGARWGRITMTALPPCHPQNQKEPDSTWGGACPTMDSGIFAAAPRAVMWPSASPSASYWPPSWI